MRPGQPILNNKSRSSGAGGQAQEPTVGGMEDVQSDAGQQQAVRPKFDGNIEFVF